jgi:hypothetical protein
MARRMRGEGGGERRENGEWGLGEFGELEEGRVGGGS